LLQGAVGWHQQRRRRRRRLHCKISSGAAYRNYSGISFGLTENDGHENDGPSKLQDMKLTDQVAGLGSAGREFAGHKNARHEIAGHENAGREIAGQKNIHCESKKTNRH